MCADRGSGRGEPALTNCPKGPASGRHHREFGNEIAALAVVAGGGLAASALLSRLPQAPTTMELFFRKYFWAVHLLFIFLVALLLARTVNLFVEQSLVPVSSGPSRTVAARPVATE